MAGLNPRPKPLTDDQMAELVRNGHERFLHLAAAIAIKNRREAKAGLKAMRDALDSVDAELRRK